MAPLTKHARKHPDQNLFSRIRPDGRFAHCIIQ